MNGIRIAPSILAWDLGDLERAVEISVQGRADQVHLDVIDGHFAPNITFGPGTVKALRSRTDLKFDTHLMIENPQAYVDKFLDAGSDIITFHTEVMNGSVFDDLQRTVRARGREVGLAVKPETEVPKWALERLDKVSALVVMTVNPGFSGQKLDPAVLPKLQKAREYIEENGLGTDLEVDGGVEPENVQEVVRRGGNVLVAGAGVYGKKDPVGAVAVLRERAESARRRK
ncbi:MAG: ribulose-phosphate 3-epimerase [Nitrososphaerota archaeon]|nr:ribulose-phosphate 3-epimerase [Nitrososphaerota archaeon]MDG6956040.1 ribulose-phosphate 3-epimerase [Nitrososphaerota archaeon]MDG6968931.1 ribulose-phosphate 3-epimerase [Nitrososphaerota archaeon]MDG7015500.1 ribulose-phosphate 3-epimerase [Nitrososphaerota archaeon]WGO50237.1 MAG: ribulose-phosphate 3-epimerase [Nitrososphaerota archaeon]